MVAKRVKMPSILRRSNSFQQDIVNLWVWSSNVCNNTMKYGYEVDNIQSKQIVTACKCEYASVKAERSGGGKWEKYFQRRYPSEGGTESLRNRYICAICISQFQMKMYWIQDENKSKGRNGIMKNERAQYKLGQTHSHYKFSWKPKVNW